jgi:amino acid adenylation domain-containing protein
LTQLVANWAVATPDAVAVKKQAESLTYDELELRSNQLANYLLGFGVCRETIVGIALERSIEAVISALAVLKSGACYLPLDPAYPRERIRLMLNDAQPRVVISKSNLAEQLPEGNWKIVTLDLERTKIDSCETDVHIEKANPEDLAYVIYTSGSTGEPKGVQVTHANLLNLVAWHQAAFGVTANDRASLLASVGFDASVWETWPYLAAGASLHIPDNETRITPDLLRDWLVSSRISISFLPTVLAEQLMTMAWPDDTSLRFLLTGADTLRRFPSAGLPFAVINNYGPTECTVVATSGTVTPEIDRESLPTIGRPIANTEIYLLDENLKQVPTGIAGEIYIGGVGVARGYLNRPELTGERFINDPFSGDANARLYRTGDLARKLSNGEIAYLGRVDEQIKVRGYRIEPNEIIAVLDRHPDVRASVVVARGADCSEKHLVAYVVAANHNSVTAESLRTFLRMELPDYMVPAVFVQVDSLPTTENGKIDRKALPAPDAANTLWEQEFTAPRNPLEERLAEMLAALLGIAEVSVNDNFFLLGGHSLLGTQLIGQIRGAFAVDLTLRSLFDAPTIAELAVEVESLLRSRIEAMSEDEVARQLA